MKKIFKSMLLLALAGAGTTSFVSCSDDDNLTQADALFRPIINESENIEHSLDADLSPCMNIKWDRYTDANQYILKIEAIDGSDTREVTVDSIAYKFENLEYDMEYNIYLSAANTNTGLKSKPFTLTTTTLDYPTALNAITTGDVIDNAVKVSWNVIDYDSLVIITDDTEEYVKKTVLSEADNEAKTVIIKGLNPTTSYRVLAYSNGKYQGKKRFTTVAPEDFGDAKVVDIRNLDEDASLKWICTANIDSVVTEYPDQDITIVLQGGMDYRIETVKLPSTTGTIKFITGLTLKGNAIWHVTGNFDLPSGVNIGGVEFEKIEFTDDESKPKTGSNYGGTYLFNLNSDATAGTISLKSSTIRYKRGVLRVRKTIVVENFVADDCIFEYIGGYGITNVDNSGAAIKNIQVTNSTFADCNRLFVNTKNKTANCSQNVNIENCTFVYAAAASRGFIELQETAIAGGINIKNCIFGCAGAVHTSPETGIKGWSGTVVPATDNCFFTSDLEWALDAAGSPVNALAGTTLSTDTKNTFLNPNPEGDLMPGDYTLLNQNAIDAKVGDPRWIQ